jgi:hypothetical protein
MKIEIVVDPLRPAPPASLASRVAPAPSTAAAATEPRGTRFVQRGLLRPHLSYQFIGLEYVVLVVEEVVEGRVVTGLKRA